MACQKENSLEQLKKKIAAFEKAQNECRDWGAGDTEPDWHFQNLIGQALQGRPWESLDADGWDLFSDKPGAHNAAAKLNEAAKQVYDHIQANGIYKYLTDYCWRVNLSMVDE
jgi:hypothetical protein